MSIKINFKRGDTFKFACQLLADDTAINITGFAIRSQIRNGDTLVDDLDATITDFVNGTYEIKKDAVDTALWPVGNFTMDIEFTDAAEAVFSTETIKIHLIKDTTLDS